MHDRMIVEPIDIALRAVGVTPVRALKEGPPLTPVAQIDWARRLREDKRPGIEHVRQRARIVLRVRRNLGKGDVAGCFDELLELAIRDRRAVHPEVVHRDAVNRCLLGIVPIRAHVKRTARHVEHTGIRRMLPRLSAAR